MQLAKRNTEPSLSQLGRYWRQVQGSTQSARAANVWELFENDTTKSGSGSLLKSQAGANFQT